MFFRTSGPRSGRHRSALLLPAVPMLVLAAACDSSTGTVLVQVPSVTFEAVGDALQLEANVPGSTALPEWESLDPHIVAVTRAGMAVAVAPGTARVVARVRSGSGEGTVTVLPHVSVDVVGLERLSLEDGLEQVRVDLKNLGGRGFYRLRIMRDPLEPGGEHTPIHNPWNDHAVSTGDSYWFQVTVSAPADWVVVYSRSPHSEEYRRTGCARFDGGDCPLPPLP
jgi:hypothetical protein